MKYFLFALLLIPFFIKAQTITTYAGGGVGGGLDGVGDGLYKDSAIIPDPVGCFFDKLGNCYIASSLGGNRIRKIDTFGVITSFAGNGIGGYNGDGGLAIYAQLNFPDASAFDSSGNLYISDGQNNKIRKVDKISGIITTIAGTDSAGYNGDNILATQAWLNAPGDICFDKKGNLYIADGQNNRIRRINSLGIITTFAGNGIYGLSGDGGPATSAQLWLPWGLACDDSGNIYISDQGNFRIRKVNTFGTIRDVRGVLQGTSNCK